MKLVTVGSVASISNTFIELKAPTISTAGEATICACTSDTCSGLIAWNNSSIRTAISVVTGDASSKSPTTRPNPEPPKIISSGVASSLALTSEIADAISPELPSITAFNASIEVIAFIIVVKSASTALVSSIFENTRFCEFVVSALNSSNAPCMSATSVTPRYPAISYARPVISPEAEPFINSRTSSLCDALIAVNNVLASVKFSSVMSLSEPPALTNVFATCVPGGSRSSTLASRTLTASSKSSPVEPSEATVTCRF